MTDRQILLLKYLADARFNNNDMRGEEREAVAAALEQLDSLRAAGDALADAARESGEQLFGLGVGAAWNLESDRDADEAVLLRQRVNAALATWAAARGEDSAAGEAEVGAEAAQQTSQAPPAAPTPREGSPP